MRLWTRIALAIGLVSASAAVVLVAPVRGQSARPPELQDVIPLDPAIHTARLVNGVTYLIRKNDRPAHRVFLRLAVKAGSIEEASDQVGIAHLIEHMAFEGSTHFKPGQIVSSFESVGVRLGPHLNAATNFDETVYMLDLPTERSEVVAGGLTALADFASGLTFGADGLDKEKNVVIEEWRGGLGAGRRVLDRQLPVLLFQSRYAERLPIGNPDTIRNITVPQLRAFYDAWYRPDRMAVVAVGDVDPDALERAVATLFGGMTARAPALPEPDRAVPLHKDLLISVVTDPEVTRSALEVVRKRPREDETHAADYRRQLVDRLVARMLNQRFAELAQKPEAKFLGATVSDRPLTEKVALFVAGAGVADGQLQEGLRVVAIEGERARRYGFAASELDRAKKWLGATYDRAYLERDKTESASLASEYLRHFLVDEPAPGIEYEYRLVQQVLPGISLDDVKSAVQRLLTDQSRVVLIVAPQNASVQVPSKEQLTKTLIDAERAPLEAWSDTSVSRELVDPKPHPGTIAARRTLDPLAITVVRFSNGIEAWLKPTDFRNDQILFTMEAPGGLSLSPAENYLNASLATAYVIASGAGGLSATDLQKLLTGRQATAVPFASLSTHGISGNATPGEIELALQLLYQEFVAPGDDEDAFALIKRRLDAAFANRGQSPQQVFAERVAQVNTSGHYTTAPVTPERIGTLDRRQMFAFYRDRFSNAADFRFVMVGAFKVDDVVPLLAQYVGSLPVNGTRPSNFRDVGIRFPTSVQRVEVEKGREPRSQTLISFFAEPSLDPVQQENLTEAMTVLETQLRDVLRESLGQTYNVSVQLDQIFPQRGGGHVQVGFAAAPEHIAAMTERVLQEIKRLQQDGPSADLTNRAKAAARQNDNAVLKQNAYWLRRLTIARVIGGDPSAILKRGERINAVTPETLRTAFRRYFPADRFTVVTLVPAR